MSLPPFDDSFTPKQAASPNPAWQFGEKVGQTAAGKEWLEGEKQGWKSIDTSAADSMTLLYPLMISGIVPRPVAFVSTISESGVENLAPFSWFNMVSFSPPSICISVTNRPRVKDTCHNIKTMKGFTVNIISEPFLENANATAIDAPEGVSEWDLSGLTRAESTVVKAARVKESAFSMECELLQAIDVNHPETGEGMNTLIIGFVKYIHVRNDMLNERGVVDPVKFKPISRLGDITYGRLGDMTRLPRFSWETEKKKVEEMVQHQ